MAHPGMYRGDRRRKEDARKAKQEAKRARKAERAEGGASGPEIEADPEASRGGAPSGFVWFSPSKGRTVTTSSAAPPVAEGVDDWVLVSEPPRPAS
jgi:hypothetical protein